MLIAGKTGIAKGKRWSGAYYAAVAALQTPTVSLLYAVANKRVWWLACKTMDAAPTSLGAALPGTAGYKGPGVYVSGTWAVANTGEDLRARQGNAAIFQTWADDLGLPIHDVTDSKVAAWRSHVELVREQERATWRLTVIVGLVAAMVATAAYGWLVWTKANLTRPVVVEGNVGQSLQRLGEVTALTTEQQGETVWYSITGGKESVALLIHPGAKLKATAIIKGATVTDTEDGRLLVEGGK